MMNESLPSPSERRSHIAKPPFGNFLRLAVGRPQGALIPGILVLLVGSAFVVTRD